MSDFEKEHARSDNIDTSHQAAASVEQSASQLKGLVFNYLKDAGPRTSEEVADGLGLVHGQVWKRVSDLKNDGAIVDSGERRRNRSGRSAAVWAISLPEPVDLFGMPVAVE